jgi:NAD(P)H-flavin reductase
MHDLANNLFITTDDGSYGRKSFNTEVLKEVLTEKEIDLVYACGPVLMMEKATQIAKER